MPRIEPRHVTRSRVDRRLSADLPPPRISSFRAAPAGAAQLHVARTVCRRAERLAVTLSRGEAVGDQVVVYLNRLSDLLFVMARWENRKRETPDVLWDSRA